MDMAKNTARNIVEDRATTMAGNWGCPRITATSAPERPAPAPPPPQLDPGARIDAARRDKLAPHVKFGA